jgi:hypothetical protein
VKFAGAAGGVFVAAVLPTVAATSATTPITSSAVARAARLDTRCIIKPPVSDRDPRP